MGGKRKMNSTENIFSDLKILKFININLYLTGGLMTRFLEEMCQGYLAVFPIAIILYIITLHDKVNISIYLWRNAISLSYAHGTGVLLFGMRF